MMKIRVPNSIKYPKLYTELTDRVHDQPVSWLSDEIFAEATKKFPVVCTDVVLVDEQNRFVLSYRRHACAQGWWWMGGMLNALTSPEKNIDRLLGREIGLSIPEVTYLGQFFHVWNDTRERPNESRMDMILLHFVKVTEEQILQISLDPKEYDVSVGLLRYDGTQAVRPVVKDMFISYHRFL